MAEQKARRTGSAGRFGARYGRVARRRVADIERAMRTEHACPSCGETRVARKGTGIWTCEACDYTFAGGSYRPSTPAGRTVNRSIRAALAEDDE